MSDRPIPESLITIMESYPRLGEIIRFGYELTDELNRIKPDLDLTGMELSQEQATLKLKQGFPLVNKAEVMIPADQFKGTFRRIAHFVADRRTLLRPTILKISERLEDEGTDVHSLVRVHLNQMHKQDREHELRRLWKNPDEYPMLDFLLGAGLKPYGHAYGNALNSYLPSDGDLWLESFCPLCGTTPLLSYIEGEEGRRHLLCSWCDTTWEYSRLKCPYCQTTDQKDLTYFFLEDDEGKKERDRISVCKRCKRYIKTLDLRKREGKQECTLHIDDLATLHLDLLAEREGYERMTRHILFF
ncbi:MAG: formate dehydrogenase accessory protein FdhE [bacterium]